MRVSRQNWDKFGEYPQNKSICHPYQRLYGRVVAGYSFLVRP